MCVLWFAIALSEIILIRLKTVLLCQTTRALVKEATAKQRQWQQQSVKCDRRRNRPRAQSLWKSRDLNCGYQNRRNQHMNEVCERERGQKRNALPENDSLLPYLTCVPRIIFVLAHIRLAERKLKEQWITHISTEWVQNSANNKEKTICLARMRMTIAVELLNSGSIDQENHQPNGSVQKPQKNSKLFEITHPNKYKSNGPPNYELRYVLSIDKCVNLTAWRNNI